MSVATLTPFEAAARRTLQLSLDTPFEELLPMQQHQVRVIVARLSGEPAPQLQRGSSDFSTSNAGPDRESAQPDEDQLEKPEQHEVVKRYRAYGCRIYNLSQARRTKQTPGLPDLWVFSARVETGWWHETKRPVGGKFSPAQAEFAELCRLTHTGYVAGGVKAAEQQLVALRLAVHVGSGIQPIHLYPNGAPDPAARGG